MKSQFELAKFINRLRQAVDLHFSSYLSLFLKTPF